MRRIINSTYISLDGVIQNPQNWPSLGSFSDEGEKIQTALLASCDVLLMGRHTYDAFAAVWPTRTGDPYSDRINSMRKYVVSSTFTDAQWANTRVIDGAGDPVAEIARIKQEPGQDIVQYGFGRLSYALLEAGLLDELRLWVHPFFVGRAEAQDVLFRPSVPSIFALADTHQLPSGTIVLTYQARKSND